MISLHKNSKALGADTDHRTDGTQASLMMDWNDGDKVAHGQVRTVVYVPQRIRKNINLVGIIGAAIILAGECLPFMSIPWFRSLLAFNFYQILGKTRGYLVAIGSVFVPPLMLTTYFLRNKEVSMFLSSAACVCYIYEIANIFSRSSSETIFALTGIGFWLIWVGLVLSIVSPLLGKANNSLLQFVLHFTRRAISKLNQDFPN